MTKQKLSIAIIGLPVRKSSSGEIEFLLSQRHQPERPLWHHKWQLIGGGLEWGETPEQTLAREFEEEAGISCQILWPYPIVKTSTWVGKNNKADHDSHILLLNYIVDIGKQKPDCHSDEETNNLEWFSLAEFVKLDALPNTKEFLLEAEKIIKKEKLLEL